MKEYLLRRMKLRKVILPVEVKKMKRMFKSTHHLNNP